MEMTQEKTLLDAVTSSGESLPLNLEGYSKIGFQFRGDSISSGQGIFTVEGTIDGQTWVRLNTLIDNVTNSNSQEITRVDRKIISSSVSHSTSASISPSASLSPSASASASSSASVSPSASASASLSFTSLSLSPSASRSPSASVSPSASASLSRSPSASLSPSASASISPSASLSPSASISPSASASVSPSGSVSPSASASLSPSLGADITSSVLVYLDNWVALKAVRVSLLRTGDGTYSAFAIASV